MIYLLDSRFVLLLSVIILVGESTTLYQNDYEPRVFDHIPLNCYDCLSYRDIILTQLTNITARSFENFNLGSRDTNMILNGQLKLIFHPYAFQSLTVQKPNKTLTITFAAPNSWLNITENTFHGLDLRAYSTLRIIIKFFYGCTFHRNSLSGIKLGKHSRLIIDISSVTQIHFHNNIIEQNDFNSSIDFIISRTDTILFDSYSFSSLNINSNQIISFYFELVSHIHLKSYSFQSLQLQSSSSFRFYTLFLSRLTIDSYAFQNISFDTNSIFNLTVQTLGTCLCLKSHTFDNLHQMSESRNIQILLTFNTLRGLSFFPYTFSNLTLYHPQNQLKITSDNPLNDPNPIINFATETFSSINLGFITLNFTSITVIRLENNALKTDYLIHKIHFKDITLVDISLLNSSLIKTNLNIHFDNVRYVKWFKPVEKQISVEKNSINHRSLIQFHFKYISNSSCLIYETPRSVPWLFPTLNTTICNCPLLFAYKHGQLDGQLIPCIRSMSGHETARQMNECNFDQKESTCYSTLQSLTDLNANHTQTMRENSYEIDNLLIRQLYDRNYLSCSYNYSSFSSTFIVRSRLFDNLGLVIGIILAIFIILLILVMALLNGLQYKMREYDETWTWRRNMSWTSLRRTLSQTSLRRSRRDLRTLNGNGRTSKSDNQLDRLRYEQADSDEQELDNEFVQSRSIQENLKKNIQP